MKIAVAYEKGEIFQHFGHTEQFMLYRAEEPGAGELLNTEGSGHGALVELLREHGVDVLICGGIGEGARKGLEAAGIRLYGGVSGSAEEAVQAFLAGTLQYDPAVRCSHHDGEEGHSCGNHGGHCH